MFSAGNELLNLIDHVADEHRWQNVSSMLFVSEDTDTLLAGMVNGPQSTPAYSAQR